MHCHTTIVLRSLHYAALLIVCCGMFLVLQSYAAFAGRGEGAPLANVARIGGDETRTRFVVDLSRLVKYKVFILRSPNRVVIDLPPVKFLFPEGQGKKDKGLIQAFRYGLVGQGKSRIVIDVKHPVRISKTFIKKPEYGQPARLVLELVQDRKAGTKRVSQNVPETVRKRKMKPPNKVGQFLPIAKPSREGSLPVAGRRPPKDNRTVIVLDAGHGGEDAGARSRRGTKEKHIVLAFAQALKKHLEKTGLYKVLMTRDSDVFISLRDRVLFAIAQKAGLFISIHADSVPGSWRRKRRARGATIYTLSKEGATELDRLIAEEQNKTPVMAKISFPKGFREVLGNANQSGEIPDIIKDLTELTQRETNKYSVTFAKKHLYKRLKKVTNLSRRPVRAADFHVLRNAEIPSVLLELGFVSNKHDVRNLKSRKWRKKVSKAVAKAVQSYMERSNVRRPY